LFFPRLLIRDNLLVVSSIRATSFGFVAGIHALPVFAPLIG